MTSHQIAIEKTPEKPKGLKEGSLYQGNHGGFFMLFLVPPTQSTKEKQRFALLNLCTGQTTDAVTRETMEIELDIVTDIDTECAFDDGPFKRIMPGTELAFLVDED